MSKEKGFFISILMFVLVFSSFAFSQEKIKLTYWEHQFPLYVDWTQRMIEEYEKENPNVEIEFMVDHAHERLLPAIFAGVGPSISVPHESKVITLMMRGYLAPIRLEAFPEFDSYQELESAYFPNALTPFKMDGEIYGLPINLAVSSMVVNEKLFRMAGIEPVEENIPKHWDEVGEVGGKIFEAIGKDERGNIVYEGWDWSYSERIAWRRDDIRAVFVEYGAGFVNENGEVIVDSPQAIEAMTMMKDMIHKYKTGDPNAIPGAEGRDWQIFNGTLAMGHYPGGEISRMVAQEDVKDDLAVYPFPYPRNRDPVVPLKAHVFMVNGNMSEEEQIEAWKFVNYLTKQWQEIASWGQVPPRIYPTPNSIPWYETEWFGDVRSQSQALSTLPLEELAKGNGAWTIGPSLFGTDKARQHMDEITDAVGQALEKIVFTNYDVEKALKEAKREIEIILGY